MVSPPHLCSLVNWSSTTGLTLQVIIEERQRSKHPNEHTIRLRPLAITSKLNLEHSRPIKGMRHHSMIERYRRRPLRVRQLLGLFSGYGSKLKVTEFCFQIYECIVTIHNARSNVAIRLVPSVILTGFWYYYNAHDLMCLSTKSIHGTINSSHPSSPGRCWY